MSSVKLYPSFGVGSVQSFYIVCGTRACRSRKIRKLYSINEPDSMLPLRALGSLVFSTPLAFNDVFRNSQAIPAAKRTNLRKGFRGIYGKSIKSKSQPPRGQHVLKSRTNLEPCPGLALWKEADASP